MLSKYTSAVLPSCLRTDEKGAWRVHAGHVRQWPPVGVVRTSGQWIAAARRARWLSEISLGNGVIGGIHDTVAIQILIRCR
jgi:hypothetical protein